MSSQTFVLQGHLVVFLLVHLLINDILLRYAQGTTGPLLVNLGRATGRFHTGFETSITSSGSGNICPYIESVYCQCSGRGRFKSYRSWFSSCVLSLFMAFDGGVVRCGGIVRKIVYGGGMSGWRIIGWSEPSYSEDKRWVPRKTGGEAVILKL